MTLTEVTQDLFATPEEYYLVHCVSADFALGVGIAKEFTKRFDMRNKLRTNHPDYLDKYTRHRIGGDCILEGRVLNLITKERYYMKPTIITLRIALEKMRQICLANNIKKLAMPRIGCGLDRLRWDNVKKNLEDIFANTDIEILVCNL